MNLMKSNQFVSVLSLVIAIFALSANAWRAETSESNRNLRIAGFEMFKQLNQLEQIIHHLQFGSSGTPQKHEDQLITGWSHLLFLIDLSKLMPEEVEQSIQQLRETWKIHSPAIGEEEGNSKPISEAIDASRLIIHHSLAELT